MSQAMELAVWRLEVGSTDVGPYNYTIKRCASVILKGEIKNL